MLASQVAVLLCDVIVVVPRLTFAVIELHIAHATLKQSTGNENLPGLCGIAVTIAHVLRFVLDVKRIGRLHLHAVGEFV